MSGSADLMMATSGNAGGLTSSIVGPSFASSGMSASHTFSTNTCTASGGTGPYTYLWSRTSDTNGTWNTGGTSTTFTPAATAVFKGDLTIATYVCTVTDNVGAKAISNSVQYQYANTSP